MSKNIEVRQYVNLEQPPITTSAAELPTTESSSKLLSAKTVPFRVVDVTPTTMKIDKEGKRSTVSMDRPTVAPTAKKTSTEDNSTRTDDNDAEREEAHVGDKQMEESIAFNAPL